MTPKEKAKELLIVLEPREESIEYDHIKHCALVCVSEIQIAFKNTLENGQLDSDNWYFINKYWELVKQEIQLLKQ